MSRRLRIAFYGEGNTDHRVIPPLIEKIIRELSPRETFDLSIVPQNWGRGPFPDAVVEVVRGTQILFDVVVAHVDADDPDDRAARLHKLNPAEAALAEAGLSEPVVVWAVPVQAVEAWLLVSAEAFAIAVAGQFERASELSLPRHPERVHRDEAKRILRESIYQLLSRTARRRRRVQPERYRASIANEIPIGAIRRLPAFARFESDLKRVLVDLGYVNG